MIITIDGPTASGKSTVAQLLAKKLRFYYLNTGLLYRAVAYILMDRKKYTQEMLALPIKEDLEEIIDPKRLIYTYDEAPHIALDNVDITDYLKDAAIDQAASIISAVPTVREMLLQFQQSLATQHDIVAEGRDTGSIVFPNADYKFYITADLNVRAKRWQELQKARGNIVTQQAANDMLKERDERDSKRDIAPLVKPQGAIVINNSNMSLQETLQSLLKVIQPYSDS